MEEELNPEAYILLGVDIKSWGGMRRYAAFSYVDFEGKLVNDSIHPKSGDVPDELWAVREAMGILKSRRNKALANIRRAEQRRREERNKEKRNGRKVHGTESGEGGV